MTPAAKDVAAAAREKQSKIMTQALREAKDTFGAQLADSWAGVGDSNLPMWKMGASNAASQTYNAAALFTNNATASVKG